MKAWLKTWADRALAFIKEPCISQYGFGAQFLPKDEEGQKRMKMAELKNARLAMIAFGGAVTQAVITAHPFPWLF